MTADRVVSAAPANVSVIAGASTAKSLVVISRDVTITVSMSLCGGCRAPSAAEPVT